MKTISKNRFDKFFENVSRHTAQNLSRRSLITRLGIYIAGTSFLPLLPVSRKAQAQTQGQVQTEENQTASTSEQSQMSEEEKKQFASEFANNAQTEDPTQCNYWRYCASDGYLCACCGGGPSKCPPGTSPSPTSWVGSCINPDDGNTYLIAYRDCCGQDSCGQCGCLGLEGEMPAYRPHLNNDIIWCFGASSMVYHCSSAALIGRA